MSTEKKAPAAAKDPEPKRPAAAWAGVVDPALLAGAIAWKGWGDEPLTERTVRDAVKAVAGREVGS